MAPAAAANEPQPFESLRAALGNVEGQRAGVGPREH